MAPGAVFYASTGREKKMANFSCEDTARLGNAKDRDEPSALRRRRDSVEGGRPAGTDTSRPGGLRPRAATASPLLRRNPSINDPAGAPRGAMGVCHNTDTSVRRSANEMPMITGAKPETTIR